MKEYLQLPTDDDALLTEQQLSLLTGFSLSRLRNDRYLKQGFTFVKIGASVRYRVGDYRAQVRANVVEIKN